MITGEGFIYLLMENSWFYHFPNRKTLMFSKVSCTTALRWNKETFLQTMTYFIESPGHSFFLFLFQKKRAPAPWPLLVRTLTLRFIIHFLAFLAAAVRKAQAGRAPGPHTQTAFTCDSIFYGAEQRETHPQKGREARNEAKPQNTPHYPNHPQHQEMAMQVLAKDRWRQRLNDG